MKTCRICRLELPVGLFSKDKSRKDGLRNSCKPCDKKRSSEWYANNKERGSETRKKWAAKNKEKTRSYDANCYARNREKYRAIELTHYQENADLILARRRHLYATNPLKIEISKSKNQARRARLKSAQGKINKHDIAWLRKTQRHKCACCRSDIRKKFHVDHIMPLFSGGTNDRSNIQLLCPSCNFSKGAKHPVDFMQSRGFLL